MPKFEKYLEILKQFDLKSNFLSQIHQPRLSDFKFIAADLIADFFRFILKINHLVDAEELYFSEILCFI